MSEFEIVEKKGLFDLESAAWVVGEVAEHASELHRAIWSYFKVLEHTEFSSETSRAQELREEAQGWIASEHRCLLGAISRFPLEASSLKQFGSGSEKQ